MSLELHPLCTLFPRMSGADFSALCDDIETNGLRQPIVLRDGMILDGGNRYRACLEVGIEPQFTTYYGDSIVSFVLSANLHRRHLSAGQQAAIVASAQDWAKAQKPGREGNGQALDRLATVQDRATAAGVSRVTQMKADKVAKADPELSKKVAHGEVSLPQAERAVSERAEKKPAKSSKRTLTVAAPAEVEHDDMRAAVSALTDENDALKQRIAVESMDASEEDRTAANDLIEQLRSRVRALEAELDGVKSMRDSLLVENGALKKQCASYVRKLRALEVES